ncbi:carboxypeptidase-like regulatory domain-containing protein [Polaribacter sp. Q13]|uniref:carboxypeptidase-like regulatory domain-containing protein n=1 Tax=Polaribacter sp. Q13 TaxID=2806551 RepID=UPI00193B4DB8|nr:carboxypeptidase-like regulatory domain-containing protein [Polaribacter sp. Q13]QVY65528.1 carboxypeptidase-like regulatory domain-containing protein [Polaribacter sp. Q13]
MKKLLAIFTFLISIPILEAQEKRTFITGTTVLDSLAIADVHIVNKNSNIGTITNDHGFFEIPVKIGDTLFYSHLKYKHKQIVITDNIISARNLNIQLEENTVVLKEIVLEKQESIFYRDPEITTYKGPVVNAAKLNLPYANTTINEDKSLVKFRSGTSINLGNLINTINGNKKREKLLKEMALEDTELEKIRKHFTDDFFITDLKIQKVYINQFLNYCIDKNIIRIFKRDNKLDVLKLLMKESKLFPRKIVNEDLYLTDH